MAEITMPKLSDTMTEGVLIAWKKKAGESVSSGEVIAEVETDKATMEMEAFEDGVLSDLVAEGTRVAVGEKIAVIGEAGAAAAPKAAAATAVTVAKNTPAADKQAVPDMEKPAAQLVGRDVSPATSDASTAPAADANGHGNGNGHGVPANGERVKASPLAKKVAAAQGVSLGGLTGSGPGGRIVQKDVLAAASSPGGQARTSPVLTPAATPATPTAKAPVPAPAKAAPAFVPRVAGQGQKETRVPLTGMRKTIADRLLQSKTTIPHFYLHTEVDAAPLATLRAEVNAAHEKEGIKVSVNDFILKAVAVALTRVPKVNASFATDSVVEFSSVYLAVAVAVDDGLVTPVIKDAQAKSLLEINMEVKDLASRARNKKLKPEEYQGGTFTVSNLGAYGIDTFDAIINPPQAAILSVGALVKKPVVNKNGELAVGQRIDLGLSCDHRVVDGALGATFLAELRKLIESPVLMLL